MKKVLLVFFGLVLLFQGYQIWERGQQASSVKRHVPTRMHKARPDNGGGEDTKASVMIAQGGEIGNGAKVSSGTMAFFGPDQLTHATSGGVSLWNLKYDLARR